MTEQWLPVVGYEGLYEVSNLGRVQSLPRTTTSGRIMKLDKDSNGYPRVMLSKNNVQRRFRVHKLVTRAFLGECPVGKEVCHVQDVKSNVCLSNLYYGTRKENVEDMKRHGTFHGYGKVYL